MNTLLYAVYYKLDTRLTRREEIEACCEQSAKDKIKAKHPDCEIIAVSLVLSERQEYSNEQT